MSNNFQLVYRNRLRVTHLGSNVELIPKVVPPVQAGGQGARGANNNGRRRRGGNN